MNRILANRPVLSAASFALAAGLLFVARAGAADLNPRLVATWNSASENSYPINAAVSGSTLLVLQGGTEDALIALDVSNPANPVELGTYPLSDPESMRVVTAGQLAYVLGARDGLAIFDVTNPAEPVWLGGYDTDGYASDVCLAGTYAYIADDVGGLVVLDVSNPANPTWVGARRFSGWARGVSVSGNHAYLTDWGPDEYPDAGALRVMDISDPASPRLIASYQVKGPAYSIAVANGVAYVSDSLGLDVINVADPAKPRRITTRSVRGSPVIVGNRLVTGAEVLDISDPTAPRRLGGYPVWPYKPGSVAVAGRYVYMALGYGFGGGLKILDLEPEANFVRVGGLATSGDAVSVAVSGTVACVADKSRRVRVVDVSDPTKPIALGEFPTPQSPSYVAMRGNHAFVVETWSTGSGASTRYFSTLKALDVSNPAAPQQVGLYQISLGAGGCSFSDDHAFLQLGDGGNTQRIEVIDLRDPVHLSRVAAYEQQSLVAVHGSLAAFRDWPGLQWKDLSDPTNLVTLGSFQPDAGDYISTAALSGKLAFLGTSDEFTGISKVGLVILDLSDPTQPKRLGSVAEPTLEWWICRSFAFANGYLYVGSSQYGGHGVQVYDVRDPALPSYVGGNSAVSAHGLALAGNYLLAAGGPAGLQVFGPLPGSPPPAPTLGVTRTGNTLKLSWPASATGFMLEASGLLAAASTWSPEPTAPVLVSDQNVVTLEIGTGSRFFRLKKQ